MSESASSDVLTAEPVDADEIRAALGGDGAAYARLVERHQREIAGYLWRFTRDPGVVEELTQEVFVEAYYSLPGFRGTGAFLHWLKQIATRVGYRYWKRRQKNRRNVELSEENWPETPDEAGSAESTREAAQLVHRMLEKLPPRDRLVLTLLYLQGHSVEEAAQLSGWSRTMVKVQAFRARGKLKRLMEGIDT
jgi:RNA polymerase sigma-70 factor (ECF subfamily)